MHLNCIYEVVLEDGVFIFAVVVSLAEQGGDNRLQPEANRCLST